MSAPVIVDVDLRDPRPQISRRASQVRAVVWWGDRLLGETVVMGSRTWALMREELFEQFRERVAAIGWVPAHTGKSGTVTAADVTVIVCSRERPDLLVGCLNAVRDLDPAPAEVVVVDNAPTTRRTAEAAEQFGARRIVEPSAGLSHARNAGWRAAETSVVAFTDDDARPHARWVGALCEGFVAREVGCVTGLIVAGELATPAQRIFEANGGMGKGYVPRLFSAETVGLQSFRIGQARTWPSRGRRSSGSAGSTCAWVPAAQLAGATTSMRSSVYWQRARSRSTSRTPSSVTCTAAMC